MKSWNRMGKLQESRLRWYGHVIRANDNLLAKIGLNIEVDGKRLKCQPKQRWIDTLDGDLKASSLHPDQVFDRANGETNHDKPPPLVSGTRAEEKKNIPLCK